MVRKNLIFWLGDFEQEDDLRFAAVLVAFLFLGQAAATAHAEETGVVRKVSENKFAALPGLPSCISQAVESGDPTQGPSILIFRGTAGCTIPMHWHTPTENVMIVKGSASVRMSGRDGAVVIGPGGYAMMPSKHVHEFTCTADCMGFVSSDAAFDIHYVDKSGNEIPAETALAGKKKR